MNITSRLRDDDGLWAALADTEDALLYAGLPSGVAMLERFLWNLDPSPELHLLLNRVARVARTTSNTSIAVVAVDKLLEIYQA